MKKTLLFLFLLASVIVSAQDEMMNDSNMESELPTYDKWSIEIYGGAHKPTRQFAKGYYSQPLSFYQANLGVRYMFNTKAGMRLSLGYNSIENDTQSPVFESSYFRSTLEAVINLTSVLDFQEWTDCLGLQFHAGGGYSFIDYNKPVAIDKKDNMFHIMAGLTPMIKLSNSIALIGDASAIGNYKQKHTWDGTRLLNGTEYRGLNGMIFNFSLGVNIYLGAAEKHADWFSEKNLMEEKISKLDDRLTKVETDLIDTDMDGVPDYLDREPNTVSGVSVNTHGVANDLNKNGIPDELEPSLNEMYVNKGDYKAGDSNGISVKELLDKGYVNVYFEFNSDRPATYSLEAINYLMKFMKDNPSANAELVGFADELGNADYNNRLSERRAKKVYDILIASGVDAGRLSYRGGGEDTSVDKSSSPARQLVRRVTFQLK